MYINLKAKRSTYFVDFPWGRNCCCNTLYTRLGCTIQGGNTQNIPSPSAVCTFSRLE